jgi:hypothetical protein
MSAVIRHAVFRISLYPTVIQKRWIVNCVTKSVFARSTVTVIKALNIPSR